MIKAMMNVSLPSVSAKALSITGLLAVLFYVCASLFVVLKGTSTVQTVENTMASQVMAFGDHAPVRKAPSSQPSQTAHGLLKSDDLAATPHHGEDAHGDDHHAPDVAGDDDLASLAAQMHKNPLLPAPFEGLTEVTRHGVLPVIGGNKLTPFKAYKKPYTRNIRRPSLALGVRNFDTPGIDFKAALQALPDNISIVLSPYSSHIDDRQKVARASAHEVWLEIPFETARFPLDDPGPRGILSHAGLRYNQDNFFWALSRTTGYAGIVAHTGKAFDDAKPMLQGLLQDAFARGLGYVELNPKAALSKNIAATKDAPFVKNAVRAEMQSHALTEVFEVLKAKASVGGYAVGVLTLNPALLENIRPLIAKAEQDGFDIVPLSAPADNPL